MTMKVRFVEPSRVYRMIREELDAAYFEVMSKGDLIDRGQKELVRAVDLATQQFDRTKIPRDPIPARMEEARQIVNNLLKELARMKLLP